MKKQEDDFFGFYVVIAGILLLIVFLPPLGIPIVLVTGVLKLINGNFKS